jgi:hypothetical protein
MNETFITQSINNFLKINDYFIIQCIFPGGQGALNFKVNGRPVYPDLIAFKNGTLIIGENKPSYNESDHKKLKKIKNSFNFNEKAQEIVNNFFKSKKIPYSKILRIDFFLGFKESKIKPLDYVKFFNVRDNGQVLMLEN